MDDPDYFGVKSGNLRDAGIIAAKSKSPLIHRTKQFESLRTLSLRQPRAWLIVNG
jgi:hypothetical protein